MDIRNYWLGISLSLMLIACGGGGSDSKGSANGNKAPVANAGSNQTVTETETVNLSGSGSDSDGNIVSYQWSQIAGMPTVSISNSNQANASFTAPTTGTNTTLTFTLTVTDNEGRTDSDNIQVQVVVEAADTININGTATYDNVPHNSSSSGLDYNNTQQDPIRGATVQLIKASTINSNSPTILATTTTDDDGEYIFTNANTNGENIIIRVKAESINVAQNSSEPSWNMSVVDNTNDEALYVLDSSSHATFNNITIDLHASSGWGNTSYTSIRAAAPFHILDRAYDMILKLQTIDPDIQLPALKLNWSKNNVPTGDNISNGQIGTSYYIDGDIYILGAANNDTDEYDGHVILHEMGHYFEDKLSRSDSIGGNHSDDNRLDMRVAFSEGFGNAWAGMMTDDPMYHDSNGNKQANGFSIDVENGTTSTPGWYNETSIENILYDLYDSDNESSDSISLGLKPIYEVLIGSQKNTAAFTSIFSFIANLKSENSSYLTEINSIVSNHNIVSASLDIYGSTETNDAGGGSNVLPIYTTVTAGLVGETLCSVNDYDDDSGNKLSIFRFVRFTVPTASSYTLSATPTGSNSESADIDFQIFKNGSWIDTIESEWEGVIESDTRHYTSGDYVAAFYEYGNTTTQSPSQDSCFVVTLQ